MIQRAKTLAFNHLAALLVVLLSPAAGIANAAAPEPAANPSRDSGRPIPFGMPSEQIRQRMPQAPSATFLDLRGVAVDNSGNVYVAGSAGEQDNSEFVTVKYTSRGNRAWVRRYSGPQGGHNSLSGVEVDSNGGVYLTGASENTPGNHDYDFVTVKYDSNGNPLWVRRFDGPAKGADWPTGIAIDKNGNAYVTGDNQISDSRWDFTTVKYNKDGKQLWAKRYSGPYAGSNAPSGIAVDGSGNVYVTGDSQSGQDRFDFATVKYNSDGTTEWVRRYGGQTGGFNYPTGIAVSQKGSVYVTGVTNNEGTSMDYTTIKYSPGGKQGWVRRYATTGNDISQGVAVDGQGQAYVTGNSGRGDISTVAYASNGGKKWVRTYAGPFPGSNSAQSIAVDGSGNVYVSGASAGDGTSMDFVTIKYSGSGKSQWVRRFDGPQNGFDNPSALAVDNGGNSYVAGLAQTQPDRSDFVTIKYSPEGKPLWTRYYNAQ